MKTYIFNVSVRNSTIIEVKANNEVEAKASALNEFEESEIIHDLCKPNEMDIELELEEAVEFKTASTFMIGELEDAKERCRELNDQLFHLPLGLWTRSHFYISADAPNTQNPEEGKRILCISADEITDSEIELLNLTEDFIIK